MAQPVPSFLAARAAAAKAASHAAKRKEKAAPPNAPAPAPATAKPTARANAAAKCPENGHMPGLSQIAKKSTGRKAKGKGQEGRELQSTEPPAEPGSFSGVVRGYAGRADVFDVVTARDPLVWDGALDAMLAGAKRTGAAGVADRLALYRMVGLPWTQVGMSANSAREIGAGIAGALGHAISRLEGHKRHALVTVDHAPTLEAADNGHSWRVGHVLPEHADGGQGNKPPAAEGRQEEEEGKGGGK